MPNRDDHAVRLKMERISVTSHFCDALSTFHRLATVLPSRPPRESSRKWGESRRWYLLIKHQEYLQCPPSSDGRVRWTETDLHYVLVVCIPTCRLSAKQRMYSVIVALLQLSSTQWCSVLQRVYSVVVFWDNAPWLRTVIIAPGTNSLRFLYLVRRSSCLK